MLEVRHLRWGASAQTLLHYSRCILPLLVSYLSLVHLWSLNHAARQIARAN